MQKAEAAPILAPRTAGQPVGVVARRGRERFWAVRKEEEERRGQEQKGRQDGGGLTHDGKARVLVWSILSALRLCWAAPPWRPATPGSLSCAGGKRCLAAPLRAPQLSQPSCLTGLTPSSFA